MSDTSRRNDHAHRLPRRAVFACFAGLLATVAVLPQASAAPPLLPISLEDGRLSGAGAEVLRAHMPGAQFILFGEDHGFADSPILLRALARDARPSGFKYCVMEVGPISLAEAADALATGGVKALDKVLHDTPAAMPFVSQSEDAALATDFLGRDARGTPYLWGVDQEYLFSPRLHLQYLMSHAAGPAQRDDIGQLLAAENKAFAAADDTQAFLERADDAVFDRLAKDSVSTDETRDLLAEMRASAQIYQLYRTGRNYDSNSRRAALLARHFLARYAASADQRPKILLKMGLQHMALGTNLNNQVDLGTLTSMIAEADGQSALRIAFLPAGGRNLVFSPHPPGMTAVQPYDSSETRALLTAIGVPPDSIPARGWSLIALAPIRSALDTKGLKALTAMQRMTVLGFDYLITTPDAQPATPLGQ